MNRVKSLLIIAAFMLGSVMSYGQYKLTWVGNTYGDNAHHVSNCARSMWVATNGVVYTASIWDENSSDIGVYSNGLTIGAMGGTGAAQGSCIAGDNTNIFVELQAHNGQVGRFNRSNGVNDLSFTVTASTNTLPAGGAGPLINGIADVNGQTLYVSDTVDNLIQVWSTAGVFQYQWSATAPGAIAVETNGAYVWVAQMSTGTLIRYGTNGIAGTIIAMGTNSRPSALYVNPQNQLWVGDQGPDMNIKIYTNLTATPGLSSTYGVTGGYLSTNDGVIMGTTGAKRFTRVVGIGSDNAGNVYVLNNPWGGTWDLGRNGGTDLHCYNSLGSLIWTLQSLNFEGVAAADPGTDGTNLYSGEFLFTGSGGGGFVANTINPFLYPNDQRINTSLQSRGEDFASVACVGTNRILAVYSQDPAAVETYYFNAANGYIAIPGLTFGYTGARIYNGFQLEPATGDLWLSYNGSTIIHNPLTGFSTNGQPVWGSPISVPTPAGIMPLNRLGYVPGSDTMVLAGGSSTFGLIGNTIQVYQGWLAGNTNNPNSVITLTRAQAKSMAVVGAYVFIGYYATNTIDVFELDNGSLVETLSNSSSVYVGNDIDSMYGITAYLKSNGQYQITKDNYNGSSVVIYTWPLTGPPDPTTGLAAAAVGSDQINLSWTASLYATSYNVKRATTSGGPYTIIANRATATSYNDVGLTAGVTYYYVVSAVNTSGEGGNSSEASVTTFNSAWLTQDIGVVGIVGSVSYSNGTYAVTGSGSDIAGTAEQFRYLYQGGGTNCTITARVASMNDPYSGAKAGVMIRATLATNATEASITLTPANGVTWQYRTTTGGTTSGSRAATLVAPYWVRLVRSGSTFTGYASAEGVAWTQEFTVSITMANTVYIGLAVTSRTTGALIANFDNITVSGSLPTPPAGLTAMAASTSQINLNWRATSGATSYNVKRAAVSGGPYTTIATGVTAANYSDTGLASSVSYYYVISAVNTGGESANSTEASTTTLTTAPTGLTAAAVSTSQINLNWMASSGATGYNVKRAMVSGGPYTTIATGVTGTSYSNIGLAAATYFYVVSAVNAGGESADSTEVSATTILPPLAIGSGGGQILVFWPASAGTNYTLQMTTNLATGPWVPVTNAVPQISFTVSNSEPAVFFRLQ
ncbi:MAG: hypothetical protein JWR19_3529 [Pedosphaera sp.]|nr:hypothetical protein [Pedosphaera sp.]